MRLLVIVSADYGELGNALCFLKGHTLGIPPLVMLSPTLIRAIGPRDDLDLTPYRDLADIRSAIVAFGPDAVLLCSGYLLSIGRRFSLFNALRLLHILNVRRLPVLTSDPFLGLVGGPWTLHFAPVMHGGNATSRRFRGFLAALRTSILGYQLRGACHIYPAPADRLRPTRTSLLRRGYFNPAAWAAPATVATSAVAPAVDRSSSWIFVLSEIDYRLQQRALGEHFVRHLAARLAEAALHRKVVLIGPASAVAAIRVLLVDTTRIELRSEDLYPEFMARLMDAEYAFFWNIYSFSLIHRVMAARPAMFFSEGHMIEIMPALHTAGIALFCDGWHPPVLALDQPLDALAIDRIAEVTRRQFLKIAAGLRRGEEPATVLRAAVERFGQTP